MLRNFLNVWLDIIRNFPWALLFARAVLIVFVIPLHELAHGLVATLLGDPTPREKGALTLKPASHWEAAGTMLALLLGVGWGKRSEINPHLMRIPAWLGGSLALLAGPLVNVALVVGGLLLLDGMSLTPSIPQTHLPTLAQWLTVLVRFNLGLALINLLPLFPLDMHQLLRVWLPLRARARWNAVAGKTTFVLGLGAVLLLWMPLPLYRQWLSPLVASIRTQFIGW